MQSGQQLALQQLPQRHEIALDDRHKASAVSSIDAKPLLSSSVGQSSIVTSGDTSGTNKVLLFINCS